MNRPWRSGDSKSVITSVQFRTDQRCDYSHSEKALRQHLPCLYSPVLCQVIADTQSLSCYRKKKVKKPNNFDVDTARYPPPEGWTLYYCPNTEMKPHHK